MPPSEDDAPEEPVNLDHLQSDLTDMELNLAERRDLLKRGYQLRDEYRLESEVDIDVPPVIADYVLALVREDASMTVEERDLFLFDELLSFEARTVRYHLPNGDVLESGSSGIVLRHESDERREG